MDVNPDWVPPCGLYCGVCGIMYATRDDSPKFRERLAGVYNLPPDEIHCEGCLAEGDAVFAYCRVCPIKTCTAGRGYEGCHQCDDFPCQAIDDFPMPVGKRVILRAVPRWREIGTEAWVAEEEARYVCPACGARLFRGAKRCRECGEPVDVD
jgi:predicted RNA-binding Zn-ribbon protein involved in translation (DUF1610 family)